MIEQLPLDTPAQRLSVGQWLRKVFIAEKLLNPVGYILLALLAIVYGLIIARLGLVPGLALAAMAVMLPVLYCIVAHPKFGILVLLTMAYYIMFMMRLVTTTFPMGTIMDGLEALLILGFLIKQRADKNFEMFKNPISYMILVWFCYNIMQAVNPSASSILAWVYTVRNVAFVTLMYFVFLKNITSVKFIRVLIAMWLVYAVIGALYGVKQEIFGFSASEQAAMDADPERAALYFQAGHWRKFSIFNDPVVFAYNMVLASLLCIGLIWGPTKNWQKWILGGLIGLFFLSMLFSGTRGAFALTPVGVILFSVLNFNRRIAIMGVLGAMFFVVLIFMPTSNPNILRFQTAFKPGKDASYLLRQMNQQRIKPFIHTHPLGGGLGSVGVWGQKFSPGSMLANFPPDSGYVRVAVELGWIGMLIFCWMMFTILKTGVVNFFKIQDPELRCYCLAMTIMIFAINVGNYPQEALVQFPTNIYFFLMVALLNKCLQLDEEKRGVVHLKPKAPYVAV
ncbi:O-antigen ligase family protein [Mucilaginibacter myungsuensis]|uniref:O-antigen ligase family protein n=1 Tax=Mucilaginibacter myungsuensis TaxID=649104 RepID=A0A929KX38_9SPHI|nr:O-antigen ligase family protein [Mucilaginibacter myungsuensis]MBE9662065.1 O-antigen ligase family protein [Mucilaginibacter myungsuensis]MDN3599501.1 O-antigen ligase family protein [Mucilaginibacter myungsuensis]